MKFEIEHTYETLVEKVYKTSIEVNDEDIIEYLNNSCTTLDGSEISCELENYIFWEVNDDFTENGDSIDGDTGITIENIDQLVEYYKPFLNQKEVSCCDDQTGNYCSICGKKLR